MRRTFLIAAAWLALLAAVLIAPGRAEAMTSAAPAGLAGAVEDQSTVQEAAYVCRRVWRCGYYGCGWRRACWWTGRPYWRHRHYRRHYWRY